MARTPHKLTYSVRKSLLTAMVLFSVSTAVLSAVMILLTAFDFYGEGFLREMAWRKPTLLLLAVWLGLNSILLACGLLLREWVFKPLVYIGAATAKIAEGDYEQRIPLPKVHNELYCLSEDINYMAEQVAFAERTKMDFISTISHELRTPLTAIGGWGETLLQEEAKRQNADDLTRRGLSIIIEESRRLDQLVKELLDFSHIQSNRMQLNKENIDVLAELDDVLFLFRERAARDGIKLFCNTSEEPAPLHGDPARIRQVFVNLLDNAFKHTPQGGCVAVTGEFDSETPQRLHVEIQDNGCGVPEKDLPHLTEKFFKSSASTKGSGIGLAVADEILKAHESRLYFESTAGQGFTAHILFPLKPKTES